jgi:hypothetical protein
MTVLTDRVDVATSASRESLEAMNVAKRVRDSKAHAIQQASHGMLQPPIREVAA